MALLAKSGTPGLASPTPSRENTITGLLAGEALAAGDVCYIHSNGSVMRSNGAAANAAAVAVGICPAATPVGEAVTLFINVNFHYGAALTPGTPLYVATTAGGLDTAATTGGTVAVARVIDASRIRFTGQA